MGQAILCFPGSSANCNFSTTVSMWDAYQHPLSTLRFARVCFPPVFICFWQQKEQIVKLEWFNKVIESLSSFTVPNFTILSFGVKIVGKPKKNKQQQIVKLKWGYDLCWTLWLFVCWVERFVCRLAIPKRTYLLFNLNAILCSAMLYAPWGPIPESGRFLGEAISYST